MTEVSISSRLVGASMKMASAPAAALDERHVHVNGAGPEPAGR